MKTIEYTISEADAVRHLIVCDTQFTWAGVTNLTMPQMMDLQARGWVVEGDDNDEFQLTEAGEAVVARALQHGVLKTLADAQPGGRVRLGDALPPLPPMGYEERGTGMGPHDVYYSPVAYTAQQMQDYAHAALSAQPSPGGQGDEIRQLRERIDAYSVSQVCDKDEISRQAITIRNLRNALAARQPVGEVNAESALSKARHALAEQCEWGSEKRACLSGELDSSPAMKALISVCAAPPAQAVDLGQFRAAVYEARCSHQAMERKAEMQECDRLLDLIDSRDSRNG